MCPTLTVGSFFYSRKVHFFVHLFSLTKHTANLRTSSKIIKPTSRTLKTTKDPHFGYLGVFNLDFFGTMRLCFLKFFDCTKGSPLQFFNILEHNRCLKIPRGPPFRFFGTRRLFKTVMFHLTLGFLNTYPPMFFFQYYPKFFMNWSWSII